MITQDAGENAENNENRENGENGLLINCSKGYKMVQRPRKEV
jgi:hypothetical protein